MIAGREEDASRMLREFLDGAAASPDPAAADVLTSMAARDAMRAALMRQMDEHQVLLLPPCGVTAFAHGTRRYRAGDSEIGTFQAMMPATFVNLLGLPAVVIPFGMSADGLPIGIQLVGRPYEEEVLLELAVRLEEARGPFTGPAL
jgi:Asp-tRNA(Asn)/Glu-tRNA(Gln) amidotransferase A subunit family amidase